MASEAITPSLDLPVLLFAAGLTLGTAILFGLFPALHSTRPNLVSALKGQTGQPSGARAAARFRTSLAVVQIALSMALLVAAGLFTKSLLNVGRVDLGLDADNVVTFSVAPELNGYKPEQSRQLFERLEAELAAVPGVTGATGSMVPLLAGSNWNTSVWVEGFEVGPDTNNSSSFNMVGPGFFRTLGIRMLSGREFRPADALGAPKVAVVNEAFARKFNLGRHAVGKRMSMGGPKQGEGAPPLDIEIVGLVQDAKYSEVKDAIPPQFFVPYRQDKEVGSLFLYARTSLDGEGLLGAAARAVARLDPNLPLDDLRTLRQQVRENVFMDRFVVRPVGGVCRPGHAPGGNRPLRRARLHPGAADPRDRPADGARGGARAHSPDGASADRADDSRRRDHRAAGGARPRPRGAVAAVPAEGVRPRGAGCRGGRPRAGVPRRRLPARAPRLADRPDPRAAIRVGSGASRTNQAAGPSPAYRFTADGFTTGSSLRPLQSSNEPS